MLILSIGISAAHAQEDSAKNKMSFKIGMYYNSHLNYYGRTDDLQSSAFFPMAEWWIGKFYINAAPVFTTNHAQGTQYAGAVSTLGFFSSNNKSSAHIYLSKPIYKDNSQLVQSALKAQLSGSFSKLNKILNVTAGGDLKWSDHIDYGASFGLDHIFRKQLPRSTVLVIDPSAFVYAGTRRFTQTRYEKSGFLIFPGPDQEITSKTSKFTILSYEFSAPVILAKGKWIFLLTPSYVIPQNLVTIADQPAATEKGRSTFYITTGIKYSL